MSIERTNRLQIALQKAKSGLGKEGDASSELLQTRPVIE